MGLLSLKLTVSRCNDGSLGNSLFTTPSDVDEYFLGRDRFGFLHYMSSTMTSLASVCFFAVLVPLIQKSAFTTSLLHIELQDPVISL